MRNVGNWATTGRMLSVLFLIVAGGCVSQRTPLAAGGDRQVRFELLAPDARSVALLGDFNGWAPPGVALAGPDRAGNWRLVMVVPGASGRISYVYLVDDQQYRTDNLRPVEPDDYGGRNNILYMP